MALSQDFRDLLAAFAAHEVANVSVIGREDLITAKLTTARQVDLLDVEALRRNHETGTP